MSSCYADSSNRIIKDLEEAILQGLFLQTQNKNLEIIIFSDLSFNVLNPECADLKSIG